MIDPVIKEGTAHGGISATLIYEESGVMVHTFEPEHFVTVYIDSCTRYRAKDVKDVIRQYFNPKHIRHVIIKPIE